MQFGPPGPSLSFSIGGDGWRWGEERQETAEEIEEALLARREHRRIKEREERIKARKAETRAHIEERIRTYMEQYPGEEFSTRELRENIEVKNDTIAGVLHKMMEEKQLRRRRKGKQKVLWRLADNGQQERTKDEDKRPETGSRLETGPQKSKTPGIGLVDRKEKTCPVENKPVPCLPLYTRARGPVLGTGFPQAQRESGKKEAARVPRNPMGEVRDRRRTRSRRKTPIG